MTEGNFAGLSRWRVGDHGRLSYDRIACPGRDLEGCPRGVFKCTVDGTPGTWKQILPAAVTADPAPGTISKGYLILNVTQGTITRHTGSYDWQTVIGATGGKIGFYGVTPLVQPSGADQAAVTLGNVDGEVGGLTISDPPTQAEVQPLRDKAEELADGLRALSGLLHALRGALVAVSIMKGAA